MPDAQIDKAEEKQILQETILAMAITDLVLPPVVHEAGRLWKFKHAELTQKWTSAI
jgi:hypothetical protein